MDIFSRTAVLQRSWKTLSDVDVEMLQSWKKIFHQSIKRCCDLNEESAYINEEQLQLVLLQKKQLISTVRQELTSIQLCFYKPHVFILTDCNGIVIDLIGSDFIIEFLSSINMGVGTSFSIEHTGINAISLVMELKQMVVVQGPEHSLPLFFDWNCICVPIMIYDEIYGYLDLSFKADTDMELAVPLIEKIVKNIELEIIRNDPFIKQKKVFSLFDQYNLTKREKEIGYGWLVNQTTLEIALLLCISEATVRHTLKKVYSKCEVSNRGQFFRKFIL